MKKYIGTNTDLGQAALYYARKNRLERIAAEEPAGANYFIDENGDIFADQNDDQWAA